MSENIRKISCIHTKKEKNLLTFYSKNQAVNIVDPCFYTILNQHQILYHNQSQKKGVRKSSSAGFSGYYIGGEQRNDSLESEVKSVEHSIFSGDNDSYPKNTLIVGPTAIGKSTLARELTRVGKFLNAEMFFIIERREPSSIQIKT